MATAAAKIQINISNHLPLGDHISNQNINVLPLPAQSDVRLPVSHRLANGDLFASGDSADLGSVEEVVGSVKEVVGSVEEVVYPEIDDALSEARLGLPSFDFHALAGNLVACGIKTAEDLAYAARDQVVEAGVPEWAVDYLKERARSVMIQAEGGGVSAPRFY
jgi:hypothetical protein